MKHAKFEECTILCPGPSLAHLDYERDVLPNGPVVAVNTAMAEVPQADIWLVHGVALGELNKRLEEWGTSFDLLWSKGAVDIWAIYDFARANGMISLTKPHYIKWRDHMRGAGFDWWVRGAVVQDYIGWNPRTDWSAVAALAGAMIAVKNGAKHVRVIGADMRGMGYCGVAGGDLKWRDAEDDDHRRRWKMERTALSLAEKACPEHGLTLEVYDVVAAAAALEAAELESPAPREAEYGVGAPGV